MVVVVGLVVVVVAVVLFCYLHRFRSNTSSMWPLLLIQRVIL